MTQPSVFRNGSVSYLRIAATDTARSADFYRSVFGWQTDGDRFADATGYVIGHFMNDLSAVGEAGVVPYIYVDDIDATLAAVPGAGGDVNRTPYPEGDLWVALVHDPAGNAIGVWQHGARSRAQA